MSIDWPQLIAIAEFVVIITDSTVKLEIWWILVYIFCINTLDQDEIKHGLICPDGFPFAEFLKRKTYRSQAGLGVLQRNMQECVLQQFKYQAEADYSSVRTLNLASS